MMLENYSTQYYGPHDMATVHYLNQLTKDIKQDNEFAKKLVLIIKNCNESIDYYRNLLKIRVIFEYKELIPLISSEFILKSLKTMYEDLSSVELNIKSIDLKIKAYLSEHIELVFQTNFFF